MMQQADAIGPPDAQGFVHRDGVRIAYKVYGQAHSPTVVLMPTWSIIDSRFWKAQVPYLSRHFRVVTFDGRGSGRSDRPTGTTAYRGVEYAADALSVLDATETDRAVLVGLSRGVEWSIRLAAMSPDRITGVFAIGSACDLAIPQPVRAGHDWNARLPEHTGWATYNRCFWLEGDLTVFRDFFFTTMFSEPHSTKQIEDVLDWSSTVSGQLLVDTQQARLGGDDPAGEKFDELCRSVRCPVAVVHGAHDQIQPCSVGERLAELTGGSFMRIEGGGHGLMARHPVKINRLIREFVEGLHPSARARTWRRALTRRPRVLYISSPIGLGHVRRDLAIADEIRALRPDLTIDWLAQDPVTRALEDSHQNIHPASRWLESESRHIELEAGEHDLHAFQAIRRMDKVLVNNFMIFDEIVSDGDYDLVIGDEAWDVDYFLHENPELKRFPFAWMTDFVGWLPMPDGGDREAAICADYNAEMIEQRARFHRIRDRSIFVGRPEDVVPDAFGADLPLIRDWVAANFDFAGYVTGFEPPDTAARAATRQSWGCGPDDRICVVTVGGSGVGGPLLRRVLDAVPLARRAVPELRFVVVCGPRIDPASLPRRNGVRVRGYLPNLQQYLAAADMAVVQGGLSTTMELVAAGTPFIYVPLEHHFEQQFHVRHRLGRYSAGLHMNYAQASDPDLLARAIVKGLASETKFGPVETDGAKRAGALLAELL